MALFVFKQVLFQGEFLNKKLMKHAFYILFTMSFIFIFGLIGVANEPVDVIIVIDTSKSIKKSINAIKSYVKKSLYEKVISSNDKIYIFTFNETFKLNTIISKKAEGAGLDNTLVSMDANGEYTDLTNAVNKMTEYLSSETNQNRRKIIFFLTDGINDPPPWSKYKEGLQHNFFKESKKVMHNAGWITFVTSIGKNTDGQKLSKLLNAHYTELSSSPTYDEIEKKITPQITGAFENPDKYKIPITSEQEDSEISDFKNWSVKFGLRYGFIPNLQVPSFKEPINSYDDNTMPNMKEFLAHVISVTITPTYHFNQYLSAGIGIQITEGPFFNSPNTYTYINTDNMTYYTSDQGLRENEFQNFFGFGIKGYFNFNYPFSSFSVGLTLGLGYTCYIYSGSIVNTHALLVDYNSGYWLYLKYAVETSRAVHTYSVELMTTITYPVSNTLDLFLSIGCEYYFLSKLYDDLNLKQKERIEGPSYAPTFNEFENLDRRYYDVEGNFPPIWFVQIGVVYKFNL